MNMTSVVSSPDAECMQPHSHRLLQGFCLDFLTDAEKNDFPGRSHTSCQQELPQACRMAGRQDLSHLFLSGERMGLVKTERSKTCNTYKMLPPRSTPAMALGTTAVVGLPQQALGHELAHAMLLPCPHR